MKPEFTESDLAKFNIERQRFLLAHYRTISELFETLNVKRPILLDELSDKDHRTLEALAAGILRHEAVSIEGDIHPHIGRLQVGKYALLLTFSLITCVPKNIYNVADYFKSDIETIWPADENKSMPASKFLILKREDYLHVLNIDFENLISSLYKYEPNDTDYGMANLVLLELLAAYDIESNDQFWKCIKEIDQGLMSKNSIAEQRTIVLLNHYQIVKRERNLIKTEQEDVYNIIENCTEKHNLLFAAYLLLDQQEMAKKHFMKLSAEDQAQYLEYPICHFKKFDI